ncbi:hypothetical protein [uncultured Gemmiger sp.]|uniref:hypothetical protein n=1 Tax=uncultured Gemmiger sp. TaxID=1623490 RepID=UPI0025F6EC13|nr:hypothetical protein [uncultured Gemmiger sp.]
MFFIPFPPFFNRFPLHSPDGFADLHEDLLAALADGGPQRHDSGNGVELDDRHERLMPHVFLRFQSAAAEHRISDAGGDGCLELDSDVILIVLLQGRIVNDAAKVLLVVCPVCIGQRSCRHSDLMPQVIAAHAVAALQHCHDGNHMVIFHCPQPRRP